MQLRYFTKLSCDKYNGSSHRCVLAVVGYGLYVEVCCGWWWCWQQARCRWVLTWPRRPSSRCRRRMTAALRTVQTAACQTVPVTASSVPSVFCPTLPRLPHLQPLTWLRPHPDGLLAKGPRVTSRCLATSTMTHLSGPRWHHQADESLCLVQVMSLVLL